MRFSEEFELVRGDNDDWFDPLLTEDTRLYIDPFLIFQDADEFWASAHDNLIDFFNQILELIARSGFNHRSKHWRTAERLLLFPEPAEFCLGHSQGTVMGSGSGWQLRNTCLDGSVTAIRAGVHHVEHFEELTIFGPGYGADRISDIVCNVLKSYFIEYTQSIAERHDVPTELVPLPNSSWSREHRRWNFSRDSLPLNPYATRRLGILLTPSRFLRVIPVVDPSDFWDWSYTNHNEIIRDEFNYEIGRRVDSAEISRLARRHPDLVRAYMRHLEQRRQPSYDYERDPQLIRSWEHGARIAHGLQADTPDRRADFCSFIEQLVQQFIHSIEEEGGWRLLWNSDGSPRNERIVQALFRSVVVNFCKAHDIDLTGESNAGRGPVDFKFSRGWNARALVEVKLINNSRYWDGLENQTPQYMISEQISCGFFLSIGYRSRDFSRYRFERVRSAARAIRERDGVRLKPLFCDARPKDSASRKKR